MSGSSQAIDISKISGELQASQEDLVAVEEPLEIQISSPTAADSAAKSISITMRTPGNDVDLALGFLCTEGIIENAAQIVSAAHVGQPTAEDGARNILRVELAAEVNPDLDRLQRHFYTTSSCGVCGKASLESLRVTGQESLKDKGVAFSRTLISALPDKLLDQQRLFSKTGGLHAAAVFDQHGEIIHIREDVGRHNAVDKIVGTMLANEELPGHAYGLLVSGRASFELMQKALVAGIPTLAAVSAPSSLAVQLAREFDMTLIGFLRGSNFNIYAGARRIV
jgi:FdhD protein